MGGSEDPGNSPGRLSRPADTLDGEEVGVDVVVRAPVARGLFLFCTSVSDREGEAVRVPVWPSREWMLS